MAANVIFSCKVTQALAEAEAIGFRCWFGTFDPETCTIPRGIKAYPINGKKAVRVQSASETQQTSPEAPVMDFASYPSLKQASEPVPSSKKRRSHRPTKDDTMFWEPIAQGPQLTARQWKRIRSRASAFIKKQATKEIAGPHYCRYVPSDTTICNCKPHSKFGDFIYPGLKDFPESFINDFGKHLSGWNVPIWGFRPRTAVPTHHLKQYDAHIKLFNKARSFNLAFAKSVKAPPTPPKSTKVWVPSRKQTKLKPYNDSEGFTVLPVKPVRTKPVSKGVTNVYAPQMPSNRFMSLPREEEPSESIKPTAQILMYNKKDLMVHQCTPVNYYQMYDDWYINEYAHVRHPSNIGRKTYELPNHVKAAKTRLGKERIFVNENLPFQSPKAKAHGDFKPNDLGVTMPAPWSVADPSGDAIGTAPLTNGQLARHIRVNNVVTANNHILKGLTGSLKELAKALADDVKELKDLIGEKVDDVKELSTQANNSIKNIERNSVAIITNAGNVAPTQDRPSLLSAARSLPDVPASESFAQAEDDRQFRGMIATPDGLEFIGPLEALDNKFTQELTSAAFVDWVINKGHHVVGLVPYQHVVFCIDTRVWNAHGLHNFGSPARVISNRIGDWVIGLDAENRFLTDLWGTGTTLANQDGLRIYGMFAFVTNDKRRPTANHFDDMFAVLDCFPFSGEQFTPSGSIATRAFGPRRRPFRIVRPIRVNTHISVSSSNDNSNSLDFHPTITLPGGSGATGTGNNGNLFDATDRDNVRGFLSQNGFPRPQANGNDGNNDEEFLAPLPVGGKVVTEQTSEVTHVNDGTISVEEMGYRFINQYNLSDIYNVKPIIDRWHRVQTKLVTNVARGDEILRASFPQSSFENSTTFPYFSDIMTHFASAKMRVVCKVTTNSPLTYGGTMALYFDWYGRIRNQEKPTIVPPATVATQKPLKIETVCSGDYMLWDLGKQESVEFELDSTTVSNWLSRSFGVTAPQYVGDFSLHALSRLIVPTGCAQPTFTMWFAIKDVDVHTLIPRWAGNFVKAQGTSVFEGKHAIPVKAQTSFSYTHVPDQFTPFPMGLTDKYMGNVSDANATNIPEYLDHWDLVHNFTWSTTNTADSLLTEFDVVPNLCKVENGKAYASRLADTGRWYANWTGDIECMIVFGSSNFMSGKVLVSVDVGQQANANDPHGKPHYIVDVRETHQFTFNLPYNAPTPYKQVGYAGLLVDRDLSRTYQCRLQVEEPLITGLDGSSIIDVNVFFRAGPNFHFGVTRNGLFYSQPHSRAIIQGDMASTHPITTVKDNNPGYLSEPWMDYYTILKRFVSHSTIVVPDTKKNHVIPVMPYVPFSQSANPLSAMVSRHAFWNGSLRYKFKVIAGSGTFSIGFVSGVGIPQLLEGKPYGLEDRVAGNKGAFGLGAYQKFDVSKESTFEIDAPYYSHFEKLYIPLRFYETQILPIMSCNNGCIVIRPESVDKAITIEVSIAIGDDFKLYGHSSVPPKNVEANALKALSIVAYKPEKVPAGYQGAKAHGNPVSFVTKKVTDWALKGVAESVKDNADTNKEDSLAFTVVQMLTNVVKAFINQLIREAGDFIRSVFNWVSEKIDKGTILELLGLVVARYAFAKTIGTIVFDTIVIPAYALYKGRNVIVEYWERFVKLMSEAFREIRENSAINKQRSEVKTIDDIEITTSDIAEAQGAFNIMKLLTPLTAILISISGVTLNQGLFPGINKVLNNLSKTRNAAKGLEFMAENLKQVKDELVPNDELILEEIIKKGAGQTLRQLETINLDKVRHELRTNSNADKFIIDVKRKLAILDDMIIDGKLPSSLSNRIQKLYERVHKIENWLYKQGRAARVRVDPFHVSFYGDAGVGKSTYMQMFETAILKHKKWMPNQSFSRARTDYWDNYTPSNKIVKIDDLAQDARPDAPDLLEMILMKSNNPFVVPMADLEDKGMMFSAEVLLSTTNITHIADPKMFRCPEAFHRRRNLLVEVTKANPNISNQDPRHEDNLRFRLLDPLSFSKQNSLLKIVERDSNGRLRKVNTYPGLEDDDQDFAEPIVTTEYMTKKEFEAYALDEMDKYLDIQHKIVEKCLIDDQALADLLTKNDDILAFIPDNGQPILSKGLEQYMEFNSGFLSEIYHFMDITKRSKTFNMDVDNMLLNMASTNKDLNLEFFESLTNKDLQKAYLREAMSKYAPDKISTIEPLVDHLINMRSTQRLIKLNASMWSCLSHPIDQFKGIIKGYAGTRVADMVDDSFKSELTPEAHGALVSKLDKKLKLIKCSDKIKQFFNRFKISEERYVKFMVNSYYALGTIAEYFTKARGLLIFGMISVACVALLAYRKACMMFKGIAQGASDDSEEFWQRKEEEYYKARDFASDADHYWYGVNDEFGMSRSQMKRLGEDEGFGFVASRLGPKARAAQKWYEESSYGGYTNPNHQGSVDKLISKEKAKYVPPSARGSPTAHGIPVRIEGSINPKDCADVGQLYCNSILGNQLIIRNSINKNQRATMITDQLMFTTAHFWLDQNGEILDIENEEIECRDYEGLKSFKFNLNYDNLWIDRRNDQAFYKFDKPAVGFRNILKYFVNNDKMPENATGNLFLLRGFKERGICLVVHPLENVRKIKTYVPYDMGNITMQCQGYMYYSNANHGDCGALLTINDKHSNLPRVIGYHVAGMPGNDSRAFANIISLDKIKYVMEQFKIPFADAHGCDLTQTILEEKDFFRKVSELRVQPGLTSIADKAAVVGLVPGYVASRTTFSTAIIPSAISTSLKLNGIPIRKQPAILKLSDPRNINFVQPTLVATNKYLGPTAKFNQEHLNLVVDHYISVYDKYEGDISRRELSVKEVLNGVNGTNIDSIDTSTSAGYPWVTLKKPDGKIGIISEHPYTLIDSDVKKAYIERLVNAREGKSSFTLTMTFPKDELRSHAKIESVATRSIECLPMDLMMATRSLFGAFISMLYRNNDKLTCQGGRDPHSGGWSVVINRLLTKGNHFVAGDYKNFDGAIAPQLLDACTDIVNGWYNDGEENARARHTIVRDSYDRITMADGVYLRLKRGIPSGFALTMVYNSMINDIYRCLGWLGIVPSPYNTLSHMDNLIDALTLGDDHVVAVNPKFSDTFNLKTFGQWLESYGITYTDCKKNHWSNEGSKPYSSLSEITFLSRTWVPTKHLKGFFYAPLEKSSIEERLHWIKKDHGDNAANLEQLRSNIKTSLEDATLHGKEYYDMLRSAIKKSLNENALGSDFLPNASFSDNLNTFNQKLVQ